jgi:hypothetical protein
VGKPTPIGAKSGVYKNEFGNFTDVSSFVANGGQKGVQRPVLSPGMLAPIHPVAFLIITKPQVFGVPITDTYRNWPTSRPAHLHAPSASKSGSSKSRALRPGPPRAAKSST